MLQRFYDAQVQPALAGLTPSWSYVLDARRGRDERLAPFEHLRSFVGDEDQQRLADLQAIVSEKLETRSALFAAARAADLAVPPRAARDAPARGHRRARRGGVVLLTPALTMSSLPQTAIVRGREGRG